MPRRRPKPAAAPGLWDSEALIRAELFSVERLEQHALTLAAAQKVTSRATADQALARRLDANSTVLLAAYRSLASVNGNGRPITPAATWLVDNFHVVEEQVREVQNDLPPGYYRQLPKFEGGPFKGYLRVLGIAALNARYGPRSAGSRFILLHRRRVWNAGEACWMGWERKRGKLHELNRLLRGAADTTFMLTEGAIPAAIRYVVTLDADTRLPRDAVRRLVGKMAHPLNRPRFDEALGRVVEGYAVLQPRVTPSLPVGREGSLFQRVFSSTGGIDPYATAIFDVY